MRSRAEYDRIERERVARFWAAVHAGRHGPVMFEERVRPSPWRLRLDALLLDALRAAARPRRTLDRDR